MQLNNSAAYPLCSE